MPLFLPTLSTPGFFSLFHHHHHHQSHHRHSISILRISSKRDNPIGSASRPITEFDSLGPFPDSNSGPRPRGLFDRDRRLISRVLPWCDVQSLFNLRQTNFRLRKIISRHTIYRHIIKTLPLYHAILNTRYAQQVLVIDFWIFCHRVV